MFLSGIFFNRLKLAASLGRKKELSADILAGGLSWFLPGCLQINLLSKQKSPEIDIFFLILLIILVTILLRGYDILPFYASNLNYWGKND